MAQVTPDLPSDDELLWGPELRLAIAQMVQQGNAMDQIIESGRLSVTSLNLKYLRLVDGVLTVGNTVVNLPPGPPGPNGPTGPAGPPGANIELRYSGNYVQWRVIDSGNAWQNLYIDGPGDAILTGGSPFGTGFDLIGGTPASTGPGIVSGGAP